MTKNPIILLLALAMALSSSPMLAQGNVDIGLYRSGSELEVRLRPAQDFSGILSAIVFTLKWENAANADLLELQQKSAAGMYIPVLPATQVIPVGNHNYRVYAGFGFDRMDDMDVSWTAGEEYTIARIPIQGDADFALVNDAWTGELENNADYYISLDGYDRTGTIYRSLAEGGEEARWVSVMPNPNLGQFTFTLELDEASDLYIEMLNTLGQVVFQDARNGFSGTYRRDMDVRDMGAGAYKLRITRNGHTVHHKIIVQ